MFTGNLPSEAGMHEAYPYLDRSIPTIAERMSETHHTSLFSTNVWLFRGLDRGFATTNDLGITDQDGRQNSTDTNTGADKQHRHVSQLNNLVREARGRRDRDEFILVNYMDVHPPLDASSEALAKFAPDHSLSELPIGVSPERHIENEEKSYNLDLMEKLYHSAIWDFDREFAPLVEELLMDDVFVVVTSDHGIWHQNTAYSDSRLHVPLVIFTPGTEESIVPHTVSLRSIPRTIDQYINGGSQFNGPSLLETEEDQLSITEVIHHPNAVYEKTGRVDVTKENHATGEVQRDLVLIHGESRADYINGEWTPDSATGCIREIGEEILTQDVNMGEQKLSYDEGVMERLEDLGYK